MVQEFRIEPATDAHAAGIVAGVSAHRADASLFIRSASDVQHHLGDFRVGRDAGGQLVGCAALHPYSRTRDEILSVAVWPECQGRGNGLSLMNECARRAAARAAGSRRSSAASSSWSETWRGNRSSLVACWHRGEKLDVTRAMAYNTPAATQSDCSCCLVRENVPEILSPRRTRR